MVIVIGGGITGLAAAFELAQRQVPFIVLEASNRAGGLILTDKVDGFTIEAGADSLLAQKRAGLQLCEELGLAPKLISTLPPRRAYVHHRGRLHPLPSPSMLGIPATWSALATYSLLPVSARVRLALEPLIPRKRDPGVDESVAEFFARRFGRSTVRLIAEPLLGGIHAGDVNALSMRSLFPRLIEAESRPGGVLLTIMHTNPVVVGGVFRSLSAGMGELVAGLERRAEDRIRRAMAATALRREDNRWLVKCEKESFIARGVVVATPAHAASRLFAGVDAEVADLCHQVPYVSTATVALAWPRAEIPHDLEGTGFVVAREAPGEAPEQSSAAPALRVTACTWVSSKWEGRAPAGWALLRAFIGGAKDPDAVTLSDEELIGIATRELSAVLGMRTPAHLARVYRWHQAGAQHNVGHLARVERIEQRLSQLPGLVVAGSGFRATGIPDCIADGRSAAAAIAQYVSSVRSE